MYIQCVVHLRSVEIWIIDLTPMRYRSANCPDILLDDEVDALLSTDKEQQERGQTWMNRLFGDDVNKMKDYTSKISKDSSFRVLGIDIGGWSRSAQYIFCASGVVFFLLMYGILQEYVVMAKFKRSLGWFVTFLQLSGYGIVGFFQHNVINKKQNERKIPLKFYVLFAILHVMMQGFTNLAMQFLNYPAKTLFKSSRVILTMIVGGCFMGKRYSLHDCFVAMMIIAGLGLFTLSDAKTSPHFDKLGVVYIVVALCADATILNIQEYCLNLYGAGHDELVYFTYMGSGLVAFLVCLSSGELWPGIVFLNEAGSMWTLVMFMVFCTVGFLGMSCLAALTKAFGALTSAITATFRKGLTLVLSYALFPSDKALTTGHVMGAVIFLGGLLIRALQKSDASHTPRHQSWNTGKVSVSERMNSSDNILSTTVETVSTIWDELGRIHLPLDRSPGGTDFEKPFGVGSLELAGVVADSSHHRHHHNHHGRVFVAGSVHCDNDVSDGVGGLGIEVAAENESDGDAVEDSSAV